VETHKRTVFRTDLQSSPLSHIQLNAQAACRLRRPREESLWGTLSGNLRYDMINQFCGDIDFTNGRKSFPSWDGVGFQ